MAQNAHAMSLIVERSSVTVDNPSSIVSFETKGGGNWKIWDRYLCVDGKPAYHIGNICDTCEFFFVRQEGASQKVSPQKASSDLRIGLQRLDAELTQRIASILPSGKYRVSLLQCTPELTAPGTETDYFSHEQVELWGIGAHGRLTGQEGDYWKPHNPQTEYYRLGTRFLGENLRVRKKPFQMIKKRPRKVICSQLFEFCIPISPKNRLNKETVESYRERFLAGECPTALAISVMDIKGPATWEGNPKINQHWCLAHYLLDGHHKIYAAASVHKPLTVLSFIDVSRDFIGLSRRKDVEYLLDALSR